MGPDLFPWHTAWYLISPSGNFNAGPANLSVLSPNPGSDYKSKVLGAEMLPNIGLPRGVPVAVYSFSADTRDHSQCYGACSRDFIPLTTVGKPTEQSGVSSGAVETMLRSDGLEQLTYYGRPLYIYSQEQPLVLGKRHITSVGKRRWCQRFRRHPQLGEPLGNQQSKTLVSTTSHPNKVKEIADSVTVAV